MKRYERMVDRLIVNWEDTQRRSYESKKRTQELLKLCKPMSIVIEQCVIPPSIVLNSCCLLTIMNFLDLDELANAADVCHEWAELASYMFIVKHREIKMDEVVDISDVKRCLKLIRIFGGVATYVRISLVHYDDWYYDYDDPAYLIKVSRVISYFIREYCSPHCQVVKINFTD